MSERAAGSGRAGRDSILEHLLNRRMVACLFTGFASGLPLFVLTQLIPAWLRRDGIDLATIGLFSLATFPYTWKFLWSPVMDRYVPPLLGRRRGWMLITQVALLLLIGSFALFEPVWDLGKIVVLVVAVAFFSASQDIVLDAYRRELLPDEELGIGNSFFVNAYRLSALVPGSLGLILADHLSWAGVHLVVASFMLVGIVTTLLIGEQGGAELAPRTLVAAVVEPFRDFFGRRELRWALGVLLFMVLYKLGDNMATALETAFFIDVGFSNTQIGAIAKFAKLWAAIIGGVIGGVAMLRIGINRALWVFGVFQIVSILGYGALSVVGADPLMLFVAVSLEYLGVGLGTVALTAFIARLCNTHFTAVQFSLLTSIAVIPRTFANASTGFIVEAIGYTWFFVLCFCCAIPGMLMLLVVAPWNETDGG